MAVVREIDKAELNKWLEGRPPIIQDLCKKFPPDRLYLYKPTNHRVTLYSYSEDGTMTIVVSGDYNAVVFPRQVFGIKPEDLVECDLPGEKRKIMLSEMAQLYRKETGKQAWACMNGNDAENECEIHAYIEGPSNEYMNWLEKRASKSFKEAELPAFDNKSSFQFPTQAEANVNVLIEWGVLSSREASIVDSVYKFMVGNKKR